MICKFAHSFDRETFHGTEETRQQALRRAIEKLPQFDSAPETIYVGKRIPIDPGTTGLAEMILGAMRRRVREATGDSSSPYLMRVNEHQLAELDADLDRVIRGWLNKHELAPTQEKIIAISEHQVPTPSMKKADGVNGEVKDLGETTYPVTL